MSEWESKANVQWADTGSYQWSQTRTDVKIRFSVPEGTRGKNVDYFLTPSKIRAGVKGSPPVIDGKLSGLVVPDERYAKIAVQTYVVVWSHKKNAHIAVCGRW